MSLQSDYDHMMPDTTEEDRLEQKREFDEGEIDSYTENDSEFQDIVCIIADVFKKSILCLNYFVDTEELTRVLNEFLKGQIK